MEQLSAEELQRYNRNILLAEVGLAGQQKLKAARVLVVGTGGLGSPVSLYLAAAGVGHLGLVDSDCVDLSNLQRQIIHATPDLGQPKVASATEKLRRLNPHVELTPHHQRLTEENAQQILQNYDVVVDCTDNFPVRFLVNQVAVEQNKPFFHGGVLGFFGQAFSVIPQQGPCFRCIFNQAPQPGVTPTCAEVGILGTVAGMIGVVQATEVIKYILGKGELLVGRMLTYDALAMTFQEVAITRDPKCPVCGGK